MSPQAALACVRAHLDKQLTLGLDIYGPESTPMWMASLDIRTGRYPADDTRPPHIGKRVYRNIDAPRGCSLYWDQPLLVAAHALSAVTADPAYARAADAYLAAFLDRCVARNDIFLWGNHYFYDAFQDTVVKFISNDVPAPVNFQTETGDYHEIRPLSPAWDLFWRIAPRKTERALRAAARGHLVDPETGRFNRHADQRSGCAFLEHGGVIIEALAWLAARTRDRTLLEPADRMARFSFAARDPRTGLLENNPTENRWDKFTATTEVGLWAGCLLRADRHLGEPRFQSLADQAMRAWLAHGYDEQTQRFYGRLRIADGTPILTPAQTLYEPGDYADLWRPLFPVHDYPMPMAETCLRLYELTRDPLYQQACRRWANQIEQSLPARNGAGGYAEHYGRCLHFLLGCAATFDRDRADFQNLAHRLADEALQTLFAYDMFRGHPGEDRYDAVDGVGYLLLALLRLHADREPDLQALGW